YKITREQNPNRKKTPYAILSYLPITPLRQRLYASEETVEHMTWHVNHQMEDGSMLHPSDVEAWRHFDRTYPNFAVKPYNIRFGLCMDGFARHGQYSSADEGLQNLWYVGVLTRNNAKNETFMMHAPLMWTVNDLPAYGWCLDGVLLVL
ncbi:UNVERIFIED_CONTAM: hypothetical protein Sindi_0665800, partial [Sesamum indicum]